MSNGQGTVTLYGSFHLWIKRVVCGRPLTHAIHDYLYYY